jgi:hypothetical protein
MINRRALLSSQLADAEQRILESESRIDHHRLSIMQLILAKRDTSLAEQLLNVALQGHAILTASRDRIKIQLDQL